MLKRLSLALCLLAAGCGSDSSPVAPTPPAQPCQTNGTASVTFGNRSATTTHDIFWDGLRVSTIAPGQNSTPITVAAGVAHTLQTRITNTTALACAASSPIPPVCGTPTYTCAFP